ncbi:MAG TPA: cytochrome c [Thermoanaerobaculia bacterium]|nr:cytochrome c [Thermoanaerobaculia bacterium]
MKRLLLVSTLAALAACHRGETRTPATSSAPSPAATPSAQTSTSTAPNAAHGHELIAQYGCNVCHDVPGVDGPHGAMGPSLAGVASRPLISNGKVENNAENLPKFIQNPLAMNPQSSMPPLDITTADAEDIAAYLQTLK